MENVDDIAQRSCISISVHVNDMTYTIALRAIISFGFLFQNQILFFIFLLTFRVANS